MDSLLLRKHDLSMDRARELLDLEVDLVSGGCNDTVTVSPGDPGSCTNCDGPDCPKK